MNQLRTRLRARTIVQPAVEPVPSLLAVDLVVAGFAIVGAVLMSFLR